MLSEKLARHGDWLFRWRSFLPLALAPIAIGAMLHFAYPYGSPLVDDLWELFCGLITLVGVAIRGYTVGHAPKGTSGGNTKLQIASSLNVTGSYSVVRHPLYLGNFFMWLGVAMFTQSLTVIVLFVLVFWIYYERIMMAEEAFLRESFGDEFQEWAERTPAFLPACARWVSPRDPFSWRNAIRREYSGVFAVVTIFFLLELLGDYAAEGVLEVEPGWAAVFVVSAIAYLAIMFAKRKTRLLDL